MKIWIKFIIHKYDGDDLINNTLFVVKNNRIITIEYDGSKSIDQIFKDIQKEIGLINQNIIHYRPLVFNDKNNNLCIVYILRESQKMRLPPQYKYIKYKDIDIVCESPIDAKLLKISLNM